MASTVDRAAAADKGCPDPRAPDFAVSAPLRRWQNGPMIATARRLPLALVLLLAAAAPASAAVELASVFGDGMVLQRDRPIAVWGRAEPGEKVTVTLAGRSATARAAAADGRWRVELPAVAAGGPHELVVEGKDRVAVKDVLVGDVWLCSGQSNMEFAARAAASWAEAAKEADLPRLRLFHGTRAVAAEPADDVKGTWTASTAASAAGFSAVGWFFGRELLRELDVPIGLIEVAWGGTPAEAWTPREALARVPRLRPLLDRGKPGAAPSPHQASTLWNGMVAPLVPLAVRGVIWYQGESNAGRAAEYRVLFPTMIKAWRDAFGREDLPFAFVQLANFGGRGGPTQPSGGPSPWAELREAQLLTLRALPHTGMAVTIDIGDAGDIHPKNKRDVGGRLARWALATVYGRDLEWSGPLFAKMQRAGKDAKLTFDHAAGLTTTDGKPPAGFAVAGEDGNFFPGVARIEDGAVIVSHPDGRTVRAVRYAWANAPAERLNLVNGAGLPASPFRTDDLPMVTEGK